MNTPRTMRSWLATRVGDQRVGGVTHAAVAGEDVVVEGAVVVDDDECGGRDVVVVDREPAGSTPHAANVSPLAATTSTETV